MKTSRKAKDPDPIWGKSLLQEQKYRALYYKYQAEKTDLFDIGASYLRDIVKQRQK
jgi:hypothetical protein